VPEFKVKVELVCKTCNQKFYSTIPDEIHIQPEIPNVRPIRFTIEELRDGVSKDVFDTSGNIVGNAEAGGCQVSVGHPRCGGNNQYFVSELTFLPS